MSQVSMQEIGQFLYGKESQNMGIDNEPPRKKYYDACSEVEVAKTELIPRPRQSLKVFAEADSCEPLNLAPKKEIDVEPKGEIRKEQNIVMETENVLSSQIESLNQKISDMEEQINRKQKMPLLKAFKKKVMKKIRRKPSKAKKLSASKDEDGAGELPKIPDGVSSALDTSLESGGKLTKTVDSVSSALDTSVETVGKLPKPADSVTGALDSSLDIGLGPELDPVRSISEITMATGVNLDCGKNPEGGPKDKLELLQHDSDCNVTSSQDSPIPTSEATKIGKDKENREQEETSLKKIEVEETYKSGEMKISTTKTCPNKSKDDADAELLGAMSENPISDIDNGLLDETPGTSKAQGVVAGTENPSNASKTEGVSMDVENEHTAHKGHMVCDDGTLDKGGNDMQGSTVEHEDNANNDVEVEKNWQPDGTQPVEMDDDDENEVGENDVEGQINLKSNVTDDVQMQDDDGNEDVDVDNNEEDEEPNDEEEFSDNGGDQHFEGEDDDNYDEDETPVEEDYGFPYYGQEDENVIRSGGSALFHGGGDSMLPEISSLMTPTLSSMLSKPATNSQMNKQSISQEIGLAQEMILSPKSKTDIISKQSSVFYNNQQEKKKMLKSPDASDSGSSEFTPELNLGHPLQQKSSTYVPRQETMVSRQEEGVAVRMSA